MSTAMNYSDCYTLTTANVIEIIFTVGFCIILTIAVTHQTGLHKKGEFK